jgi:hypothetical protein
MAKGMMVWREKAIIWFREKADKEGGIRSRWQVSDLYG